MATPTTTYPAIRNQWNSVIGDLEPDFRPSSASRFVRMADWGAYASFREWAEANSQACMRRFAIRRTGEREVPAVTDSSIEQLTEEAELVIAYPRAWRAYSRGSDLDWLDLEDVIDADAEQVIDAIGLNGDSTYVSGESYCGATYETEPGDEVVFLVISLEVTFYRGVIGGVVSDDGGDGVSTEHADSTDNALARYDGTDAIQGTGIICDDSNNLSSVGTLACGAITSNGGLALGANAIVCGPITGSGALALGANTITSGTITTNGVDLDTALTAAAVVTDHRLVRGAGGSRGCQESVVLCDDSGNVSGVGTLGCGAITSTGALGLGANAITCGTITSNGVDLDTAITASAVVTDHRLVRGDGGSRGCQESAVVCDDSANLSGVGTVACGAITTSGTLELGANVITGDRGWKADFGGDGAGSEAEVIYSGSDGLLRVQAGTTVELYTGNTLRAQFGSTINFVAGGSYRLQLGSASAWWYIHATYRDNVHLRFGTGVDAAVGWNTSQTNHNLFLGLGNTSNTAIVAQYADIAVDFGWANQTNPTLAFQAADATDTTKNGWLARDDNDFMIGVGAGGNGDLYLNPTGVVKFGTYTAKGAEAFDGYITIKDSAGNSRKLMTCA